jgi:hypothetical protein
VRTSLTEAAEIARSIHQSSFTGSVHVRTRACWAKEMGNPRLARTLKSALCKAFDIAFGSAFSLASFLENGDELRIGGVLGEEVGVLSQPSEECARTVTQYVEDRTHCAHATAQ